MERSYDDRQKSQLDRSGRANEKPAAAGIPSPQGELDKRGRAGLPESSHEDRRPPAGYRPSDF